MILNYRLLYQTKSSLPSKFQPHQALQTLQVHHIHINQNIFIHTVSFEMLIFVVFVFFHDQCSSDLWPHSFISSLVCFRVISYSSWFISSLQFLHLQKTIIILLLQLCFYLCFEYTSMNYVLIWLHNISFIN